GCPATDADGTRFFIPKILLIAAAGGGQGESPWEHFLDRMAGRCGSSDAPQYGGQGGDADLGLGAGAGQPGCMNTTHDGGGGSGASVADGGAGGVGAPNTAEPNFCRSGARGSDGGFLIGPPGGGGGPANAVAGVGCPDDALNGGAGGAGFLGGGAGGSAGNTYTSNGPVKPGSGGGGGGGLSYIDASATNSTSTLCPNCSVQTAISELTRPTATTVYVDPRVDQAKTTKLIAQVFFANSDTMVQAGSVTFHDSTSGNDLATVDIPNGFATYNLSAKDLSAGDHQIRAIYSGASGDVNAQSSTSSAKTLTVFVNDGIVPAVSITTTTPANVTNNTDPVSVTWKSSKNGSYSVQVGGTSCANGNQVDHGTYSGAPSTTVTTSVPGPWRPGDNTIRVCVTDDEFNVGSATVTISNNTPVVTIVSADSPIPPPTT